MTRYLTRLEIARNPAVEALSALIDPASAGRAADAHHRLVWSVFADHPDRKRDFLWRAEEQGRFIVLSRREPVASPFFETPEVKAFAPDLQPGDRLAFTLRANATRTEKTGEKSKNGKEKKRHVDLVMDRLHEIPGQSELPEGAMGERPYKRMEFAAEVARDWLERQGEQAGFRLEQAEVSGYSVFALPGHVGKRRGQPQYGVLELSGRLSVTDPATFLARIAQGFGRAKAFGCGLMLIRRG